VGYFHRSLALWSLPFMSVSFLLPRMYCSQLFSLDCQAVFFFVFTSTRSDNWIFGDAPTAGKLCLAKKHVCSVLLDVQAVVDQFRNTVSLDLPPVFARVII